MPSIQRTVQSETFTNLDKASDSFNETNDCTVKALAIVCGLDYATAHATCKKHGRPARKGMYMRQSLKRMLNEHGYTCRRVAVREEFILNYPKSHQILKSATTHHPARFNKVWKNGKTYLMFVTRHVAAIVDGRTHDWSEGRAKRCEDLYEIVKLDGGAPEPAPVAKREANVQDVIREYRGELKVIRRFEKMRAINILHLDWEDRGNFKSFQESSCKFNASFEDAQYQLLVEINAKKAQLSGKILAAYNVTRQMSDLHVENAVMVLRAENK